MIERELAKNLNESSRERRRRDNWILTQQSKYSKSIDYPSKREQTKQRERNLGGNQQNPSFENFKGKPPQMKSKDRFKELYDEIGKDGFFSPPKAKKLKRRSKMVQKPVYKANKAY